LNSPTDSLPNSLPPIATETLDVSAIESSAIATEVNVSRPMITIKATKIRALNLFISNPFPCGLTDERFGCQEFSCTVLSVLEETLKPGKLSTLYIDKLPRSVSPEIVFKQ